MSAALADPPVAASPADAPPAAVESGVPAAPPDARVALPPVLDRFLWAVVGTADADAITSYLMSREESARMRQLQARRERGALSDGEELELYAHEVVSELGGLVKGAAARKRAGWRGPAA